MELKLIYILSSALSTQGDRNDPDRECVNKYNIKKCDQQSPGWSEETTCRKIEGIIEKYRYCEVKVDTNNMEACILEEILTVENTSTCSKYLNNPTNPIKTFY